MQVLITTGVSAATNSAAIYLPYDKAPLPFGDPLAATVTSAASAVFTVPGYKPTNGDAVSYSIAGTTGFLTSLATLTTQFLQPNTTYYVSSATIIGGGGTFTLGTQKASASTPAILLSTITTLGQAGGQVFVHLLSNQADGPTLPFKPGNTVLAMHGCNTGATSITLFGTNDVSSILATGAYGAPLGPNGSATTGWNVMATVSLGIPQLVTLNYDWIVASASTATLILLQN